MRGLLAIALVSSVAHATPSGDLRAGNEAYWQGDFSVAAGRYRGVVQATPESADAWFNLGTAEAGAGRTGHAVHALEQALLLRPGDPDALHNLEQARAAAVAAGLAAGGDTRVILPGDDDLGTGLLTAVAPDTLAWALVLTWALLFSALVLWRRTPSSGRRTACSFIALVAGLAALGAGGLLAGRILVVDAADHGVVVVVRADVRAGPGGRYESAAVVMGGVKVRLRSEDAGWRHVTLPDGAEGWLPVKDIAPLRRP